MKGFDLHISLQEDCTFSEINATAGGHRGLDYIPGSALLGVAASQLYSTHETDAFELFHSGKVRFGNAYPKTQSGEITYPIPLCWHHVKGETIERPSSNANNKALMKDAIFNLPKCEGGHLPDSKQAIKLRDGYIALDGHLIEPIKSFRMKTAIDASIGRAKEAALFGYDSLNAGQEFHAHIQIDDSVSKQLVDALKAVFNRNFYLGRSRSAEYGKASAKISEHTEATQNSSTNNNKISLWLQSDLALLDDNGQPVLSPSSTDLGLPVARFIAEESFLKTRRYSTWNAYKRSAEMERQVIEKGSVLVYELKDPHKEPLTNTHKQLIASGLGIERAAGLGQIWLNSPLLESLHPDFTTNTLSDTPELKVINPETDLIKWLENQCKQQAEHIDASAEAKTTARQYIHLLRSCREQKGLDSSVPVGPSQSQWGTAFHTAKTSNDLHQDLFNTSKAVCKESAKGWQDKFWDTQTQQLITFRDWFIRTIGSEPTKKHVQLLIREIMATLKEEGQQ